MSSTTTFVDKLGSTGGQDDRVMVAVLDDEDMPQLAIATVVDVITHEPTPFTPELSVRVRIDDEESQMYEPGEIVVLPRSAVKTV
ncbi:hypothetical protein [Arthrobacter bambusae]|uniref:DUF35 domain-containing protein n=1 Tax=Arthrobacter bambusae TaxID=1338426 RepID=A0AAW8D535_9MICC|nr:hypothetical protein [Arthrobacter bambusae]MDP9903232.1 hypothetical protein [Arthrobacter bambusae]MDQ0128774.1 hypothetical protein [Arthrobacter bambusae]MDQ0180115.1 hypothetical protein [Arthrobacter bambusae]